MSTLNEIQSIICELLAKELHRDPMTFDRDMSFHDLGLDSVNSLFLLGELEEQLKLDIDPLALYDNPTISSFSSFIYEIQHESR